MYRGVQYPDVTVRYGFARIPLEEKFNILMENHMDRAEIRFRRVREQVSKALENAEAPKLPVTKCAACGQPIGGHKHDAGELQADRKDTPPHAADRGEALHPARRLGAAVRGHWRALVQRRWVS